MSEFFPRFPPRRRRARIWKLRREGFRDLIMSHLWTPWGAFARKMIRGHEYLMFPLRYKEGIHVVRITSKDDHWSDLAAEERQREAIKRRRAFDVVDVNGRRPTVRFVPCLTILVDNDANGST
jgi:hypothetical protein